MQLIPDISGRVLLGGVLFGWLVQVYTAGSHVRCLFPTLMDGEGCVITLIQPYSELLRMAASDSDISCCCLLMCLPENTTHHKIY